MHRVLAYLSIGSLLFCATVRADPPAPGAVLDASNAATASELLPPEVIARYQAGEYRNTVAAWSTSPAFSPKFLEATAQNQAKLAASERGTILTGPGGARATGIYGLPFRIDASDISLSLIGGICALARRFDCVLVARAGGAVIQPSCEAVMREVLQSPATRFVRDPEAYLSEAARLDTQDD